MSAKTCRCGGDLEKRWRAAFGRRSFVYQCATCHRVSGSVPARELRELGKEGIDALARAAVKRTAQPNSKKRAYLAALRSSHWKALRERVFERAGGRCEAEEAPGIRCTRPATDLAHLTYERLGKELDVDVQAQCSGCNQDERRRRITRAVFGD